MSHPYIILSIMAVALIGLIKYSFHYTPFESTNERMRKVLRSTEVKAKGKSQSG